MTVGEPMMGAGVDMGRLWVVVANRALARIAVIDDGEAPLRDVELVVPPYTRALEPGRSSQVAPPPRIDSPRSNDDGMDPFDADAIRFGLAIGERLDEAATAGEFDRLALVAPRAFLQVLNAALEPATRTRVALELELDLARQPTPRIGALLQRHLRALPW
jgi:protein required for attachment to host cells